MQREESHVKIRDTGESMGRRSQQLGVVRLQAEECGESPAT